MILYRADSDSDRPVPVECPDGPITGATHDAEGKTIYANTHFATIDEAWDYVLHNSDIMVKWAGARVAECKTALARAQADAGEACEHRARVLANRGG